MTVTLQRTVVGIDDQSVTVQAPDGATERIPARTAIWAAGVTASRMAGVLGEHTGAETDRSGRVTVEPDLSLPGHPEVLALGDMVRVRGEDGKPVVYPGVAPVAMQMGRHAAKVVRARLQGGRARRSTTWTRATWPRSAGPARWPTCPACGSAGSPPGSSGSSSTSGISSASRVGSSCSSAGGTAS